MQAVINDLTNNRYRYYAMIHQRRNVEFNTRNKVMDNYVKDLTSYEFPNKDNICGNVDKTSVSYPTNIGKRSCLRSGIDSSRDINSMSEGILRVIKRNDTY
jgi:hypothetical protein